jgi:hypothetical protein
VPWFRVDASSDGDCIGLVGGGHYLIRGGKISVKLDLRFNVWWAVLRSVILCFFDVWVVHLFFRFVDYFSS